jgi:hypothetical protein
MDYFENRADVAAYVYAKLASSKADLPWTMTITPERSGGFYAHIATDASLVVTAENSEQLSFSFEQPST